jgi:hypothetical protein
MKALKNLGLILLIAILGALGGSENSSKGIRRFGITGILTILALVSLHNFLVLSIMLGAFVFAIGYGIPSGDDKGSGLGRFYFNIFKTELLANIFTRGTVGLLLNITWLSIPILKGNWISYFISSILIISTYSFVSWRGIGIYTIKIKDKIYSLLYSDLIVYGVIAVGFINLMATNLTFIIKF